MNISKILKGRFKIIGVPEILQGTGQPKLAIEHMKDKLSPNQ